MRAYLILIAALLLSSKAFAQQTGLDSLYTVWEDETLPDSTRVNAYRNYIWNGFLFSHPDTAEFMVEALRTYAKENKYPRASALSYNLQGIANVIQGNYPRALENFQKSLKFFEKLGDKGGIGQNLGNIGIIHKDLGNYPRALEYYQKSMLLRKKSGINMVSQTP